MNPVAYNRISKAITAMTKADAMKPIIALESTVVLGRTYQAHKRGGRDEARERFIEETIGSVVWLSGVATMNKLGDKIVAKILKTPTSNFDVGTDKILRTPFKNFMKNINPKGFSPKAVALIKGSKVLSSIILTNMFIGLVVPKFNQTLTKKLMSKRDTENNSQQDTFKKEENKAKKDIAFKGLGISAINTFTNAIENTNTGKLLSSDVGIVSGRMYSARRKEERREVAIRDIGSVYFYMWAQGHTRNILNFIESGKFTRLNPATTSILNKYLSELVKDKDLSVEEFKRLALGSEQEISKNLKFEQAEKTTMEKLTKKEPLEVIKLSDVLKKYSEPKLVQRLTDMSKLQPKREGELVLTKQQVKDALNIAEINNPKLLDEVFTEYTNGASKEEYKYVSNKKLYNLKSKMIDYIENICKSSKDGKINKKHLENMMHRNLF